MMPNLNASAGLSYVQLKIELEKVHLLNKRDVFLLLFCFQQLPLESPSALSLSLLLESTGSLDLLVLWSCHDTSWFYAFVLLDFTQLCLEFFL